MSLEREQYINSALAMLSDPDVTTDALVMKLAGNLYDAKQDASSAGDKLSLAVGPIFVAHYQMLLQLEDAVLMDTLKRLDAMNIHQGAAELTKKSLQALRAVL